MSFFSRKKKDSPEKKKTPAAGGGSDAMGYEVGAEVKARYKGRAAWEPGTIKSLKPGKDGGATAYEVYYTGLKKKEAKVAGELIVPAEVDPGAQWQFKVVWGNQVESWEPVWVMEVDVPLLVESYIATWRKNTRQRFKNAPRDANGKLLEGDGLEQQSEDEEDDDYEAEDEEDDDYEAASSSSDESESSD